MQNGGFSSPVAKETLDITEPNYRIYFKISASRLKNDLFL